ncbi:MAG TPA: CDP-alcohol phosphatidyltransferase family protein [Acetobacteraceae bacterium]|jgi:phosphatidylglycerophosphate synthase|nr:CDP-alcohol phosphatidyltransferase family protein [Acetobacteraceae bacterium]
MANDPPDVSPLERRPIAARSSGWARTLAAWLAASSVTPNQISVLSVVFAALGGGALPHGAWWSWIVAALCVQLRLICNLLDGMVAIEGGKSSPVGALYNEFPDRVSDSLLLVPIGYAAGVPWLGWLAALLAALTAYVRVFGGALRQAQDFGGVMAKQRRMAVLTVGLVVQAVETIAFGTRYALLATAIVIAAGSLVTCITRTRGIAARLGAA